MMTYLKHVGGKNHSDLKTKGFEEIKAKLYKDRKGDLIIMFNQSGNEELWNGTSKLMIVTNKYPLKKEVLSQLLKLKLKTKEDNTMALELIRFIKKQIAELEPKDSDGDEKDL
ncbi:hypothetical protein Tco_1246428 [Tanacetum coccineum]